MRSRSRLDTPTAIWIWALLLWLAAPLAAQQPTEAGSGPAATDTRVSVRNWTRVEMWRFFEPPPGGGDHEYAYPVNRFQATVRRNSVRYGVTAALQYVQFAGLPRDAVGPGPLGLGAVYFSHAGRPDSHMAWFGLPDRPDPGTSRRIGH